MIHLSIGLIVGIVMGLTGAGGALISIPLFITLLNATIKEATVLSLIAVILGTLANLIGQKGKPELKIVIPFVFAGALASYVSLPLKNLIPDIGIAIILLLIGLYSLWSIWKKSNVKIEDTETAGLLKTSFIGFNLGIITTFTGLGGGVLLVPVLMNFYRKNYQQAIPTSLLTIMLISGISFITQIKVAFKLIEIYELIFIGFGTVAAYFVLKLLLKKINKEKLEFLRKIVFTMVTLYSVSNVLLKSIEV